MNRSAPLTLLAAAGALVVVLGPRVPAQQDGGAAVGFSPGAAPRLSPTLHPPVSSSINGFWYAPAQGAALSPALAEFVRGVKLLDEDENAAEALPLVSQGALASTPLADYARYYTGRALLALERFGEAEAAFSAVAARSIEGHLPEDAALGQAKAREGRSDFEGAITVYEGLLSRKPSAPHVVLSRLASAAERGGDRPRAIDAYRRVYFEYPLSTEGSEAEEALTKLKAWEDIGTLPTLELTRADALFHARRWQASRTSYERALAGAAGVDRERAQLRIAACDVHLKRYRVAADPLKAHLSGPFADEATFHHLSVIRALAGREEYERQTRAFADRRPESPFAEEALNNLASHLIVSDEDDRADEVMRLIVARYPAGRYAERAYWRSGWWAYRDRRFSDAAALFDAGARQFPRSDYRPSWLYWSGRAWQEAGQSALALERLTLAATDYYNSYYGRLARKVLSDERAAAITPVFARTTSAAPAGTFPTAARVAQLMAAGLNLEALNELQYAQRVWGDSPPLSATIALVHNRLGHLRLGINTMKRAYPQWMAAGGESLPLEIQKVVFPLDYWPLLQKHAAARGLDPYLVAALVAQESTFDPVIRSSANAVGLMQVLPSTGRQVARQLRIPRFSTAKLTDPDTNVRLGTTIFAEGLRKFGEPYFALAAYNAGDHRVVVWRRDRPGLPQDEFIDDIPFPETQNYVKRILGTAEDYRRLYGK